MTKAHLTRRDFLKLMGISSAAWLLDSCQLASDDEIGEMAGNQTSQEAAGTSLPNILLIVFDAWSASNMSLYGYKRPTTPTIEKLAQRAVVYHHHYAAGNFTSPGTASLLTGLYPWTHRALKQRSQIFESYVNHNIFNFLPAAYDRFAYTHNIFTYILLNQFRHTIDHLLKPGALAIYKNSLAEDFFAQNFHLVNEVEKFLLKSEYTPPVSLFLSLLDHLQLHSKNAHIIESYREQYPLGLIQWIYDTSLYTYRLETAIDWIVEQTKSRTQPYFGYVHLLPPHAPYNPRVEFSNIFGDSQQPIEKPVFNPREAPDQQFFQERRLRYDQYIAYVDAEFGRLYQALEQSGGLENTILVLTTDHGEMIERGILGHITPALFEPLIHIPLLIFFPDQQTRVDIHTPTSAVDLFPTLIELAGGAPPGSSEGIPLPFQQQTGSMNRGVYIFEAKENSSRAQLAKKSFAMIEWPYKLVLYFGYDFIEDHNELYDLSSDPEELQNIYAENQPIAQKMQQTLLARIPSDIRPVSP